MNELYNIISVFASSALLLILGLMLLFSRNVKSPLLGNYRRARRSLAVAYLFFAAVGAAEYLFGGSASDVPLIRTITLAIAVSQALLFTFAMLALLETRFPGWRTVLVEAIPAMGLIAGIFAVYAFCSEAFFGIAFYACCGVYALLLIRYTFLFVRNYRRFRRRMDNHFSGNEADRLRWVAFSFCAALAIGIGALATSVFSSTTVAFWFTVVYDIFYIFFAIRFVDYAARFHVIEEAMEADVPEDDTVPEEPVLPDDSPAIAATGGKTAAHFAELDRRIEQWVADKGYTEKSVTAKMLVPMFYTNDRYLSAYINTSKKKSFSRWVNELRIGEAQHLMNAHPELTLTEIASRTGFSSKSHFGQQFRAIVGDSPSDWRLQAKNEGTK